MKTANSSRLERWFGKEYLESVSKASKDFPTPIPVIGTPKGQDGLIYVYKGDFHGMQNHGSEGDIRQYMEDKAKE